MEPDASSCMLSPSQSQGSPLPMIHCDQKVGRGPPSPPLESIHQILVETLSPAARNKVFGIVTTIEELSKVERLLVYLKLPATQHVSNPLRQAINPLGSRSEIQTTITWIRTHLEEDTQVSLPKHEVYDEYMEYCHDNDVKALSTADFGKVMKQVYPLVRPRRLGTRGNSRYCYAGLKKRVKLEEPTTPDNVQITSNMLVKATDAKEENGPARIVLEWVEKLFNEKFGNIHALAAYLVDKMHVDRNESDLEPIEASREALSVSFLDFGVKRNDPGKKRGYINFNDKDVGGNSDGESAMKKKKERLKGNEDIDKIVSNSPPFCGISDKCLDDPSPDWSFEMKGSGDCQFSPKDGEMGDFLVHSNTMGEESSNQDKLSQLRELLEKNLKRAPTSPTGSQSNSAFRPTGLGQDGILRKMSTDNWNAEFPLTLSSGGVPQGAGGEANKDMEPLRTLCGEENNQESVGSLSQRRRVSFNPLVVQDTGGLNSSSSLSTNTISSVQPSPGARKRQFIFQPISPRQHSLPQSPTTSPFISPRSTPVPAMRSRHSSGSALPLHLLPQQTGPRAFGSSSSDISRAATFGSNSESSTPFISPHGTPIPFNRSRHNSAQGRLCRSRHSSGVGPYAGRYNMTYSPMALNNLNNPYSPQPTTPLTSTEETMSIATSIANGGGPTSIQQSLALLDHQRSRHSSAESEPAMRTNVMFFDDNSKGEVDAFNFNTGRHRHASAGQAPCPTTVSISFENDNWCNLGNVHNEKNINDQDESSGINYGSLTAQPSTGTALFQDVATDSLFEDSCEGVGNMEAGSTSEIGRKDLLQDDLDMTLSALKDCDTDYSKFMEEAQQ